MRIRNTTTNKNRINQGSITGFIRSEPTEAKAENNNDIIAITVISIIVIVFFLLLQMCSPQKSNI